MKSNRVMEMRTSAQSPAQVMEGSGLWWTNRRHCIAPLNSIVPRTTTNPTPLARRTIVRQLAIFALYCVASVGVHEPELIARCLALRIPQYLWAYTLLSHINKST